MVVASVFFSITLYNPYDMGMNKDKTFSGWVYCAGKVAVQGSKA